MQDCQRKENHSCIALVSLRKARQKRQEPRTYHSEIGGKHDSEIWV
jgi:hypothetical protein